MNKIDMIVERQTRAGRPFSISLYLHLFLWLYLWWMDVGQISVICPERGKSIVLEPCCPPSLGLGRGLADQQFDIQVDGDG